MINNFIHQWIPLEEAYFNAFPSAINVIYKLIHQRPDFSGLYHFIQLVRLPY